jgi:uncharacterized protein YkwD
MATAPALRDAPAPSEIVAPPLRDAPLRSSELEPPLRDAPDRSAAAPPLLRDSDPSSARDAPVLRDGPGLAEPAASVALAIVEAHNAERTRAGLPPLRSSDLLATTAEQHARDMAEHGKMSHTGSDASNLKVRLVRAGYPFTRAGENVAVGQASVAEVMRAWMHSRGHRKNILASYTEMGASVARGADGRLYWCVEFGSPANGFDAPTVGARTDRALASRRQPGS